MKCLILFASFLSMAVAYKSFLSMNGRELINSGRSAGGSGGKVGSIQLLSPGKQVNSFKSSSISKTTRSSVSSFKPSRPTQQVLTQQLDTPILAPAPTVAEAPQLFAILVPAEEVASSHSVAAAPAPKLQLSAPSTAPAVQSQFHSVAPGATITAAIQTTHSIEVVDVPSSGSNSAPPEIHIPASSQPIELAFHSQSSPINVRQVHIPGEVSPPQHSQSEEEPEIIKTTVIKPIVQEIKEIVIPSRSITQEIKPVQEVVNQVVTRAQTQTQSSRVQSAAQLIAKPVASAPKISLSSKPTAISSGVPTFTFSSKPVSFASGTQPRIFLAITKVNGNIIKK